MLTKRFSNFCSRVFLKSRTSPLLAFCIRRSMKLVTCQNKKNCFNCSSVCNQVCHTSTIRNLINISNLTLKNKKRRRIFFLPGTISRWSLEPSGCRLRLRNVWMSSDAPTPGEAQTFSPPSSTCRTVEKNQ